MEYKINDFVMELKRLIIRHKVNLSDVFQALAIIDSEKEKKRKEEPREVAGDALCSP